MKSVTFFMHNIYAIGGTVRAVSTLANTLAEKGHDVTIISVFKINQTPYFKLDSRIRIQSLVDYNLSVSNIPALVMNRIHRKTPFLKPKHLTEHEPGLNQFSSWIERKMIRAIQRVDTDVLFGTRASFNMLIAQYAPKHVTRIGMEHANLDAYPTEFQEDMVAQYDALDMLTTLTPKDQAAYEARVSIPVIVLPNIMNAPHIDGVTKKRQIIAAGRLGYEKGFDLLIAAIAIAKDTLREHQYRVALYGDGPEHDALQTQIQQAQLEDIIQMHPATTQLDAELAESEITVIPSRAEGFGMVILEAMQQDSVVVAFERNNGPEALIEHAHNGYLVTYGDPHALAQQLMTLVAHRDPAAWSDVITAAHTTVSQHTAAHIYDIVAQKLLQ